MKRKAIIVDLDGTLCRNEHRQHHLEKNPKDWNAFFSEMHRDMPNEHISRIIHLYRTDHAVIFCTGRHNKHREATVKWLSATAGIGTYTLIMRRDDDFREDSVVKREIYMDQIAPSYDVRLVLEDRRRVVDMWRSLGLECWQVAAGEF